MPFVCRGWPAIGPPAPGSVPAPAPDPVAPPNNLFQEFMRTYIAKIRDQTLAAPATEVRDNIDRLLKPRNPNLYYDHLHMEYYYFCQQCKDYFEVAGLLDHKRIPFATGFLKDRILNQWQQHKTRM